MAILLPKRGALGYTRDNIISGYTLLMQWCSKCSIDGRACKAGRGGGGGSPPKHLREPCISFCSHFNVLMPNYHHHTNDQSLQGVLYMHDDADLGW